jgi:predicted glycogen debranching enzyme
MNPPPIIFKREITSDYSQTYEKEWIITNGLGGYASTTITGANTRGYHGLLVASFSPSLRRVLLLSKLEEEAIVDGTTHHLSLNKYPNTLYPDGNKYLEEFRLTPNPNYIYRLGTATIKKTIRMPYGENTTIITYKLESPEGIDLNIRPLVNYRDFHSRTKENSGLNLTQSQTPGGTRIANNSGEPVLYLTTSCGEYHPSETWYRNTLYDLEAERGLPDREDHWSPGIFKVSLKDQEELQVTASAEPPRKWNEAKQQVASNKKLPFSILYEWLVHSANQFIVKLPDHQTTIIAGYHWFGEWGRDSAISLPGILLTTRRYEEAKLVLRRYLQNTRDGQAPVFFDANMTPNNASIDTSLWLVYAIHKYHQYNPDRPFIEETYPKLVEIIDSQKRGTEFTRISEDHLIETKPGKYALTWMDARVNDTPVTPRIGKCVEVNALWYNALKAMENLSKFLGEDPEPYSEAASKVYTNFNRVFWSDELGYLYDYVGDEGDASLRPNQIFSISLPYPVLDRQHWGSVFKHIEKQLLTTYGLRSLSPVDPKYHRICSGGPVERDLAYHNGTVWAWLAGPFITTFTKIGGSPESPMISHMLRSFESHLNEGGLGSISEIFDGESPHHPRGCISQAWSVGELLRAISEDLSTEKKVSP